MKPRIPARPWHVAHIIGHMRTGGAERQLLNYLLAADRKDFRHTLVCMSPPGELAEMARDNGIPVVTLPVRTRHLIGSIKRYADWFRREDVAIAHTHMHHAAMWGRAGGIFGGVPVLVTTEHGKELWKGPIRLTIDRILSRYTARHIAVSKDCMEIRKRREHVNPQKMLLIPNGVPVPVSIEGRPHRDRLRQEFGIGEGTFAIGSVGRVVSAKGYEYLLDALSDIRRAHPDTVWLAVGDGDQREKLATMAEAKGLGSAVIWAGTRGDVPELLEAMDVWVMSSIREGLPVALLEAMAAGLPIVATTVGGIPDAIRDGKDGLLVPSADPAGLAAAVVKILEDEILAKTLAASAHERALTHYGIDSIARQIEDIYREEMQRTLSEAKTS